MTVRLGAFSAAAPADLARWRADIERVIPRSDETSWLYLRDEPGDPWHPVNRLMCWQVWPLKDTSPAQLAALRGPHPRSTGHYCGGPGWCPNVDGHVICAKPRYRWVDGPAMEWRISRQQWEIYREIGRYADPYWVIQGHQGGHRKLLFDWEKEALELATGGRIRNVPQAGELPYAVVDRRVTDLLAGGDLLRQWESKHFRAFTARNGMDVERYEEERRKTLGPMWGQWLRAQVDEMYEEGKSGWKALANEYRAGASEERLIRREKSEMYEQKLAALVAGE